MIYHASIFNYVDFMFYDVMVYYFNLVMHEVWYTTRGTIHLNFLHTNQMALLQVNPVQVN